MTSRIFNIGADGAMTPLAETDYDSEKVLQSLLAKYPEVLAGHDEPGSVPTRWLLISQEYGVPGEDQGSDRFSLDHLFVDQEGIPTLVEVKRASDTRARREVVAQMLDYAANGIVYWPPEQIRAKWEAGCETQGKDPGAEIASFLAGPDSDPAQFWDLVSTNLKAGKVRMVFVADRIPPELKRIVEFLNEQMDPAEVIAIEVKQYIGLGIRTLVPTVVGRTAAAETRKGERAVPGPAWTAESFFAALGEKQGPAAVGVARELLSWVEPLVTRVAWGKGRKHPSLLPVLQLVHQGQPTYPKPFFVYSYGSVEINFQYLQGYAPFSDAEKRISLVRRLREAGFEISEADIGRRPSIPLEELGDPRKMAGFKRAMEWAISELKAAAESGGEASR
jgi:hypothetical protein